MSKPSKRQPLLTAERIADLRHAKQQLVTAAAGKVPERLVLAAAVAAVRVARRQTLPAELVSERVVELARETLKSLALQPWKPGTVLLLKGHHGDGQHGITQ